ncbi:RNase P modulator RnpM [Oenococcus kitaharae]|uniref:Putative nucleic-acid-binding protein implicated in transcription termination n=1 Tax=Oenococcus kitaharae DSM 17330 TaxID=1045004 RepID=G9WIE5_9LACO|nr:YlxR family protein [Oenococcus kitaharae]EHN58957.1 Putative nucleic-acid-binding protein implicated in transcription termination [Oenococcus kitaharae DSM 17330]OEY81730.1 DNA-binding protein [Oenococcus kitaharae]OEY83961.1 DNA-binding protein [Oenococcus kitaharae]OEY85683.1 DNA-binding protein [Oenococcus kitaharae]
MAKNKTQFRKRKIPMRQDIVSGQMLPKKDLLRIVKADDQLLHLDPSGKVNGHGAYISVDVTLAKKAKTEKILDAVFEMPVPNDFYDQLIDWVDHQQARKELFSHEQIIKAKNS